jgi:tetratricopeptide (TPR) repeat protein
MQNVARLYESHRLYVFKSCMLVFHRLFVEPDENLESEEEPIEDIFKKVEGIFVTYNLDPLYYHLNLVFEFLRLEYYNHYKVYRQAEKYYEEVNDAASNLLVNYPYYTFSAQFLISKIERHVRLGLEKELYAENESLFQEFEMDTDNLPMYVIYTTYKALSSYYSGRYDEAGKFLNTLLADVSIKKYTYVVLELKTLMALQFVMQREIETFNTTSISIMRGLRSVDEDESSSVFHFLKILKIAVSEAKREKEKKIMVVIPHLKAAKVKHFAPTRLIQIDEEFIKKLISIESF